jgi:hypothetical protein
MRFIPNIRLNEKLVFSLFAIGQIIPYLFINFTPSMDGPQHLHNSQVLNQLILNNPVFHDFYQINDVLVGYWIGHFLLTVFNFIFPAYIAEKLLIAFYLVGLAFAFRYLVKAINPKPSFMTLLILPFSYSFYFLLGYYSFSIAFIFGFLVLGYFYRHRNTLNIKDSFVLFILLSALFLSHAFVFSLFGFSLVLFISIDFAFEYLVSRKFSKAFKTMLRQVLILFLASLPAIIFFVIYIRAVMVIDSTMIGESYDFHQRLHFIVRIRAFIGFHMGKESWANYFYWIAILLAINYSLHRFLIRIHTNKMQRRQILASVFSARNILGFISLSFLIIYFIIPDRISAGNLVGRLAVFFFYFLLIWVASLKLPAKISGWLMLLVMLFFLQQSTLRYKIMWQLSEFAREIHTIEEHIVPNSIVYPVRISVNWLDGHFLNYLGVDKPIINLGNPQCAGQFPVVWNYENMPKLMVGTLDVTNQSGRNHSISKSDVVRQVDYVAIYRWGEFQASDKHDEIKGIIDQYYELEAISPQKNVALFRVK